MILRTMVIALPPALEYDTKTIDVANIQLATAIRIEIYPVAIEAISPKVWTGFGSWKYCLLNAELHSGIVADGVVDGVADGVVEGVAEGVADGVVEGVGVFPFAVIGMIVGVDVQV